MIELSDKISVVIRTLNEDKHIGVLLGTLRSQDTVGEKLEIVVLDSGSTDKTLDIVRSYDVKLLKIAPNEFNYSTALNLGLENSQGDFIFILSGHSVPSSKDWVSRMIKHFADSAVAGVYCRQKSWDDANWHEKRRINNMFYKQSKMFTSSDKDNMYFSNAASCVRRSVWQKHQFIVLPAAEDREWAHRLLGLGYKIFYDAEAVVYHSHNESVRMTAKRMIDIEKANDIKKQRKRTILLTLYQALSYLFKLIAYDIKVDERFSKKVKAIFTDIKFPVYFILDFKK